MTYITARFGTAVAKPKAEVPAGKAYRRPFTEAETAKAWAKMAKAEGHERGLPKKFEEYTSADKRAELEARILAHVPTTPDRVAVIAEAADITPGVATHALTRMEADGRVIKTGIRTKSGRLILKLYALPAKGGGQA